MPTDFAHLHVHTESSLLDGLAKPGQYVDQAVRHGQSALGNTDHGYLCGIPEFYKAARKAGIEPVIGCEFYYVRDAEKSKTDKDAERSHITVLARGADGYKVLSELSTATFRQHYYKPLLDRGLIEQLGDDARHLTVLSGCAGSQLSRHILAEEDDEAREELVWWREMFPHYYIEIMDHGTSFDRRLNERLLQMAQLYNIPHVITNDPHFAVAEDAECHETLLAIQTGSGMDDPTRFKFEGEGYWLKSRKEMYHQFKKYPAEVWKEGARNTLRIVQDSITRIPPWETRMWQIPKFPDVDDPMAEVKRMCYARLRELGLRDDPAYLEPLKTELKVIRQTGIADFLLITADIIDHARSQGIAVGPGRGSVCGCLVAWLMGIHLVDPIKYKLLFERFLNPARPKMPDVDSDFSKERRSEVFAYAIEKYGVENTMMVAAFGRLQIKSAFNAVAGTYGISYLERQRLNKLIHEEYDEESGYHSYSLPLEITGPHPEMAALMEKLTGTKKSVAAHPAGLIIASPETKLYEQIPEMYIPSSKKWVAGFDKKAVESMGFLKEDFLSLRALDTLQDCANLIYERTGEVIDYESWVPDEEPGDDEVYRMCAEGRTAGVFQMEGPANQRGCRDVQPTCFEDLVSITSLYRTGAISAGFPKIFNKNRRAGTISYIHPALEPILGDTWGVVLYQEQVMEFGRTLAGFDMGLVDDIKEAIKDKSSDAMEAMHEPFVAGCVATTPGMTRPLAERVWKMIEGYAGYGYNRSHAVAYSFITYWTARFKCFYPLEFFCALIRTVPADKANQEKRDGYLREAIGEGIGVTWPDINLSSVLAHPDPVGRIQFGFQDYVGIGAVQARKIVKCRPLQGYQSLTEVEAAVNNTGVMKVLTEGSALNSLRIPGDMIRTEELLRWEFRDPMERVRPKYEHLFVPPDPLHDDPEDQAVCLIGYIYQRTEGKTKTGTDYCHWRIRWSTTEAYDVRLWSETRKHWPYPVGSVVRVRGDWDRKWLNVSTGRPGDIKLLHLPQE